MIIDDALLSKLERLSALKIPDAKREEFKGQLNKIVDFVEILNELDLQSGEAAITTLKGGTPFRKDIPRKSDVAESVLKHAPQSEGGYFVVPKIID